MSNTQNIVLDVLRTYGPLSDYGVYHVAKAKGFKLTPSGARTRRSELRAAGRVRPSGSVEITPSGRKAQVWEAV